MIPVSHFPGNHCASTGIRNLVNFHGIAWSEPLCFGIGAGLGIWYMGFENSSPSRMIHVRSADIETQFFTRIGQDFAWKQFEDPIEAEKELCRCLDKGCPAILQSDIFHLPYYDTQTHFPGHVITAWGYEQERQVFQVTDTERESVLDVPFENMRKARYCRDAYFSIQGNFYAPEEMAAPGNLPEIIRKAIRFNSHVLLNDGMDFQGVAALRKWKGEIDAWERFEDWKWTARFAYQVIEKRGTGGGGFRKMYAAFLEEAADYLPEIQTLGLAGMMRTASQAWTDLAAALKTVSEDDLPDFSEVRNRLDTLEKTEYAYHQAALKLP